MISFVLFPQASQQCMNFNIYIGIGLFDNQSLPGELEFDPLALGIDWVGNSAARSYLLWTRNSDKQTEINISESLTFVCLLPLK